MTHRELRAMSAQVVAQERDRNIWLAPIHVPVIS